MHEPAIPFVSIEDLPAQLRQLLEEMEALQGFIPNSLRTYFHRPEIALALANLMRAVLMSEKSSLASSIKGKLGIICSTINGCAYCTSHQCHMAAHPPAGTAGLNSDQIAALIDGSDKGCNPVEAACFSYARQASIDPASVGPEMLSDMKKVLSSAQIVELASIVGMWKMVNTIHDSLNLPIEESVADYARFLTIKKGNSDAQD